MRSAHLLQRRELISIEGHPEEEILALQLINALNDCVNPAIAARTREMTQVLPELPGASLERLLEKIRTNRAQAREPARISSALTKPLEL
jgi:hypothetical protein